MSPSLRVNSCCRVIRLASVDRSMSVYSCSCCSSTSRLKMCWRVSIFSLAKLPSLSHKFFDCWLLISVHSSHKSGCRSTYSSLSSACNLSFSSNDHCEVHCWCSKPGSLCALSDSNMRLKDSSSTSDDTVT